MINHVLRSSIINISATLLISIAFIKKKYYARPYKIFIFLYIIGQILGYGLGVDILKVVVPSFSDPENGVSYQIITSTIFPLIIAFVIDYIYKIFKKEERRS